MLDLLFRLHGTVCYLQYCQAEVVRLVSPHWLIDSFWFWLIDSLICEATPSSFTLSLNWSFPPLHLASDLSYNFATSWKLCPSGYCASRMAKIPSAAESVAFFARHSPAFSTVAIQWKAKMPKKNLLKWKSWTVKAINTELDVICHWTRKGMKKKESFINCIYMWFPVQHVFLAPSGFWWFSLNRSVKPVEYEVNQKQNTQIYNICFFSLIIDILHWFFLTSSMYLVLLLANNCLRTHLANTQQHELSFKVLFLVT